ncbi:hypothetical protein V2J09_003616 [Rumex salicifolius]
MKPFHPVNKEEQEDGEVRRGPWTLDEDNLLIHYTTCHGEGRWNMLAKSAGLKRTGKSCRLRWLNYLKPDIKRGNLTPQEQLLILELHSKWGNRWSKIAQHLPGRTDNEIKNYWRTRVQKQARQLNMESNSQSFFDAIRCFYMPRLVQKMEQDSFLSEIIDYHDSRDSSSPLEEALTAASSSFPPSRSGVDYTDQCNKDYSGSSVIPLSLFSSDGPNTLSPVEGLGQPSNPLGECRVSSALSSDNWYYVDNSNYDMEEFPYMSATGESFNAYVADHSWISMNMADDTWNLDGLW